MQHAVNVFPAVLDKLFRSEYLCLFVLTLQFLEFQFHAASAGFIKAFEG